MPLNILKPVIEFLTALVSNPSKQSDKLIQAKETIKTAKAENKEEKQDVKTVRHDTKQLKKMKRFVRRYLGKSEYSKLTNSEIIDQYYQIKKKLDGKKNT